MNNATASKKCTSSTPLRTAASPKKPRSEEHWLVQAFLLDLETVVIDKLPETVIQGLSSHFNLNISTTEACAGFLISCLQNGDCMEPFE